METLAFSIEHYQQTDSTNKELWRLLDHTPLLPQGKTIVAESQTAGRGLGNTSWISAAGQNLTFSLLLTPRFLEPAKQFALNKAIALGLRSAIAELLNGEGVSVKWPNDIYHGHSKIAGTLIENRIMGHTLEATVVGVGLNVNQIAFSPSLPNPTSLQLITGRFFNLQTCLRCCLQHIGKAYGILAAGDTSHMDQQYLYHLMGYGKSLKFRSNGKTFQGVIEGVDSYGKLLIRQKENTLGKYAMKEVEMML